MPLDLLSAERLRHGDDPFLTTGADGRRGKQVGATGHILDADGRWQPVEHDTPVHVAWRARRKEMR